MRTKGKYLAALALVLVAALGWTGLRLVSGQEVYHAPELVLLEGQTEYDLLSGIKYDAAQYTLNLADEGGFDVDTLGTYTLRYELIPQEAEQPTPAQDSVAEDAEQPAPPQEPVPEETKSPAELISFTRQVVVEEAVAYDDVHLEQGSEDLLTGITTSGQGYQISVVSDGGFDPNQVEEYQVTYSLRRADNGQELRQFSRYVQVTLPGVSFSASELVAEGDVTGRDWLEGIEYDHSQYTLSLLTQPDITNQQPQHLRYALTQGDTVAAIFGREVTILGGTSAEEPAQPPAADNGMANAPANGVGDTPTTLEYTGNLLLTLPSGTATDWMTAAEVFQAISQAAATEDPGTYRVDLLKNYTWTATDQAALTALTGLEAGDTLTITGDPNKTGAGVYTLSFTTNTDIVFPLSSPASYQMEQIKISGGTRTIAANGSPLTMGEGITVTGTLDVVGGGLTTTYLTVDYTFTGDSHLTVQSGTYRFVAGGSVPSFKGGANDTRLNTFYGTTHVIVTGNAVVTNLVGGSVPSVYLSAVAPYVQSTHQRQEGAEENTPLITVELSGNAVVTNLSAGNGSTNYAYYLSADKVMGQSVVKLNGGTVKTFLGGSQGTYKTDYEMEQTIFQINGNYSISTVQDFDRLELAAGSHLTVSTKLDHKFREAAALGVIQFGQNSRLTTLSSGSNLTAGSIKTMGTGATLEITKDGYLTLEGTDATDTAAGLLNITYADGAVPEGEEKLIYFSTDHSLADASKYQAAFYEDAAKAEPPITQDKTTGYIQIGQVNVALSIENGEPIPFGTLSAALSAVQNDKGLNATHNHYRIDLQKNYELTLEDAQATRDLSLPLDGDTSVVFTGDPDKTGAGVYTLSFAANCDLVLPQSQASFTIQNIKITGGTRAIAANGSNLTMGEGITVSGVLDVVGGGYAAANPTGDTYTFTGDTNLTLLSGTYRYVAAGSRPYASAWTGTVTTQGHNHLTLGGGTGTVTVTDVMGLNLIGYGSSNITNSHTGSSTVTINSGVTVTNAYAGSRGTNYNAYHTDVQTDGTITIQVNGGQIKTLLGGTPSTKASAGQLGQVVYQINGAQTIPTVQDFDQLVLAEEAHLTVSTKLHYKVREVEAAGQVVFGANSQLTTPNVASASLTVGSLKTEGQGAVLEIGRGYRLYVDADRAPMDSAGGALEIRFTNNTAPAVGDILVQYNNAPAEANRSDYLFTRQGFLLSSDAVNGYIMLGAVNIQLATPSGAVTQFASAAEAYQEITRLAGSEDAGTYRVDLLKNYTWTAADQAALTALTGLEAGDTLTLTGDPEQTGAGVYTLSFTTNTDIVFPPGSPVSYRMEQIKITGGTRTIAANGSPLTMGEGITVSGVLDVVGGGWTGTDTGDYTFTGNTNLTVLSGTYRFVAGGSRPTLSAGGTRTATTEGNTQVTVGGTTVVSNAVVGGNLLNATSTPWTKSVVSGSTSVAFTGEAKSVNLYAGSTSISYPNYMQTDTVTGTSTVTVSGGTLTGILGGTAATYSTPTGQLNQVVFQINGTVTIPTVQDFDQLVLAEGVHLTVSSKLHYMGSGKEVQAAGQVVFKANSTLRTPSAAATSRIVGSLKTEGTGATLEVPNNSYYLQLDGTNPMDSSGGVLAVKYWNAVPEENGRVLYYAHQDAPDVNPKDFISGHEDHAEFMLSQDQSRDYLIYATAKVQLTAPEASGGAVTKYPSFAMAFDDLKTMKEQGTTGEFVVALLADYGWWTQSDREALLAVDNLTAADSVTITGRTAPDADQVFALGLAQSGYRPIALELPMNSACTFTIEHIELNAQMTIYHTIAANGTPLVMGEGIEIPTYQYVTVIGGAIARDAEFNPVDDFVFTGDTNLTVKSGHYYRIIGGNLHETVSTNPAKLTLNGSINVTLEGTASVEWLAGASNFYNVYNSDLRTMESLVTGDINVTIQGSTNAPNVVLGSMRHTGNFKMDTVNGTATVTVQPDSSGNVPTLSYIYGGTSWGVGDFNKCVIRIEGEHSIPRIEGYDELQLAEKSHLTVTSGLVINRGTEPADSKRKGEIVFGADSILTLGTTSYVYAGSIRTEGTGAILEIKQNYPLYLDGGVATDATAGKLTLRYNPSDTNAANGDKLIYFRAQPNLADASCYLSGFPDQVEIIHSQTTGYVYVGTNIVTLQTNGGTAVYYSSVAAAMNQIETVNNSSNNYTITVRKQHYTMTAADLEAIDTFSGAAKSITFTSTFALTANDILESGESAGQTVTRHVIIDGDLSFRCATTLQNIYLEYQGHDGGETTTVSHNIYANGHPLTMGVGVDTGSGNYPTLYGGSKDAPVTGATSLTVRSGAYQDIYGGGQEAGATVGSTSVVYEERAALYGSIYGGGQAGDVTGNTSLTISGGTTGGEADSKVVAGGETGAVGGTAQLTISGGTAGKTMVLTGADNGTVNNVSISILEPSSGAEPSAPKAHVYGGAYGTGSVTGTANLTITNGTYYGTVSGGDVDGDMPGGGSTISFSGGDLKMENLLNFTTLNLGHNGSKCNLTVSGQLDSNTASGDGNFNRTGQMVFNNGSVLNLTGKKTHKVGSIQTTTTGGASHLHISKADGVSYPLYISLGNTSQAGYTINVGIPDSESAPATSRPAEGDDLLIFAQEGQVDLSQYLCGLTLLAPIQNVDDPKIVELGIAAEVQAKLTGVTHTKQADTATAGSNKTLSFLFTNVSDTGAVGQAPTSAYIDRTATADSTWTSGGAVPTGALGGELTSFTAVEGKDGQWTGQITLDVEALDSGNPQFYYLHVRAPGSQRTIILDVFAPEVIKDVTSSGNGQGDYTFTVQVQDKAPTGATSNPDNQDAPVYENAGLYQVGWSLMEHDPRALTASMTVEGVQTISDDDVWLPYDWTFDVTADQLADADTVGQAKVIYLYLKDTLGNTRMITVPMSEHQIDVSIPTRVGVVAMTGVDTPKVNAPQCAIINYGSQALNASVTQVRFTEEDNELKLVERPGSPNSAYGSDEINLRIKPLAGEDGSAYPLVKLASPQAQPLSMGQMSAYSADGSTNQIGFTFDALYNPQTIQETSEWSMFYLSYRFEAVGSSTAP